MGESLLGQLRALGPVEFWIWIIVAALAAVTGLHAAFRHLRLARILEDVPTARIRSAPQGYVELQGIGRALDGPPIVAPLTRTSCTWWSYRVEERASGRKNRWRTVAQETSEELFALDDDTGRCIVDPDGAEVYPMVTRRWYGATATPSPHARRRARRFGRGRFRYTEKRMHAGDPLYGIGEFRTPRAPDHGTFDTDVAALLRSWKRDRARLAARFDANRDGHIDLVEWEAARHAARAEVRRQRRELDAAPRLSVLGAPRDGRPFLLGALPQPDLARRLRRRAAVALVAFALGTVSLALLLGTRLG